MHHVMPPYAGEGLNMAMQNALGLSECLTNDDFPDLQTVIEAYEKQMRAGTAEIAQITLKQIAALHSQTTIEHLISVIG